MYTDILPMAALEEQGLEMDKKLKASIFLRHTTAPFELLDTVQEAYEELDRAITMNLTKLQDMQERFEYQIAECASFSAHIYKRVHLSELCRWTPWWKQRNGLKMHDRFLDGPNPPVASKRELGLVKESDISSIFSGTSNATTLIGM